MDYVCGVVEGFYGMPWHDSERKGLFQKLNQLELNTYMYAPKDDLKHRKLWREQYACSEKDVLRSLIQAAESKNVQFVYAISPGLDIVFSSPSDILSLKEKLQQVYDLGCRSFALLFDDIDPELCLTDKSEFASFGDAQTYVANKVLEWFSGLNLILFCPTEYCCTRAKPNVLNSEYLICLGKELNEKIQIMWTGPKVVSQTIDIESIEELSKILKRKPVIWDNIHANDYDQRRLFLGPHKGLSLKLYAHTSGFLKNPNCEFESNFIAIHTMATWLRIARTLSIENPSICGSKSDRTDDTAEAETSVVPDCEDVLYDWKLALSEAVDCWMEEFHLSRDRVQFSKFHCSKIVTGVGLHSSEEIEPGGNSADIQSSDMKNAVEDDNEKVKESTEKGADVSPEKKARQQSVLAIDDVMLLCELHYLPYEHGERAQQLLEQFMWLQSNAPDYQQPIMKEKVDEWVGCSKEFDGKCQQVHGMYERLLEIPNKRLLEQLLPYIFDVKEAVSHMAKYVKYLGSTDRQNGTAFLSADPEAWFYRGGIAEEIQMLLPRPYLGPMAKDLNNKGHSVYMIRPFLEEDKTALYQLCRELSAVPTTYDNFPDLAGDSYLEAFLRYSPNNVFIIEVGDCLSGFVAIHNNAKEFYKKVKTDWLPSICKRHKKPGDDPDSWSAEEHMVNRLHYPQIFIPDSLAERHQGVIEMRLSPNVRNEEIFRQALRCCGGENGNFSCQLKRNLNSAYEALLKKIGFTVLSLKENPPDDTVIYGLERK